jgi:hypothetical protein
VNIEVANVAAAFALIAFPGAAMNDPELPFNE